MPRLRRYIAQGPRVDSGRNLDRCLAISFTWEENHRFTDSIRKGLKERGVLPEQGTRIQVHESLLGEIGSDRSRFEDPSALQCLAGTAPVSYQSGRIHKVYLRRS
jgi:Transposase IS116/IS110/IS902 family